MAPSPFTVHTHCHLFTRQPFPTFVAAWDKQVATSDHQTSVTDFSAATSVHHVTTTENSCLPLIDAQLLSASQQQGARQISVSVLHH